MKKQLFLIVLITTLLSSCSGNKNKEVVHQNTITHQTYNLNTNKLDSLFEELDKDGKFMGSIALSYDGQIIYTNAIGFADIETNKRATVDTKYRIGSISKMYTASLVLKAVEEHKIKLEQTIESYFPKVENANKITIENLLNHRSGIHNFTNDEAFTTYYTVYKTREEMVEIISNFNSDFEPNSKDEYSNSNYVLLSIILETVYDSSLKDLIAEKISVPLHLKNTYYGSRINIANNECNSYKLSVEWIKGPEIDMSIPMGAGAIVSTSSEVTIFMEALFTGKIISAQSLEIMTTIKGTYGMGVSRFSINDRESFGHSGSLGGFKSLAMYFSKEKLGIAVTANGDANKKQEILTEALSYYFNDSFIEASASDLKKYAGDYTSVEDKSDKFKFTQEKNALILEMGPEMREALIYKGDHKFLFEQVYAESFTFVFSPEKNEMWVKQGDYEAIYKKNN
ncbi:MAG: beta-lactamase family protein [Flavobacteriales bacterium]|nr:beta-lactamase family protein [Flavobacteriales bacterium]